MDLVGFINFIRPGPLNSIFITGHLVEVIPCVFQFVQVGDILEDFFQPGQKMSTNVTPAVENTSNTMLQMMYLISIWVYE